MRLNPPRRRQNSQTKTRSVLHRGSFHCLTLRIRSPRSLWEFNAHFEFPTPLIGFETSPRWPAARQVLIVGYGYNCFLWLFIQTAESKTSVHREQTEQGFFESHAPNREMNILSDPLHHTSSVGSGKTSFLCCCDRDVSGILSCQITVVTDTNKRERERERERDFPRFKINPQSHFQNLNQHLKKKKRRIFSG